MDMEAFMAQNDDLEEEDPNRLQASNVPKADVPSSSQASSEKTIATRTYDLHITYDKFYQVPRMWLVGYSEVCHLQQKTGSFHFFDYFLL